MLEQRMLVPAVRPQPRMSSATHQTRSRKRRKVRKDSLVVLMVFLLLVTSVLAITVVALNARSEETETNEKVEITEAVKVANPDIPAIEENHPAVVTEEKAQSEPKKSAPKYTDEEVYAIAKTVYGEALVTGSDTEMAAVAWCILNRVDSSVYPNTIIGVVTQNRQFHGYNEDNPVTEHLEWLVRDVLDRWYSEKEGNKNSGRVLPSDYLYFDGDGRHNHFRTDWKSKSEWDWSLNSPYED